MTPDRILVIKLGALGDVVLALGPMAAIRHHHRGAHITVLTTAPFQEILAASPYADQVWVDTRPRVWQIGTLLALRNRLRGAGFSRVYDLQTSDRSSFYFHLMGPGRRPDWSGIARGCALPHANPRRDSMHTIERQADQLNGAGIAAIAPPELSWLHADIARFAVRQPFALLVPGGAVSRPHKRWPAEHYAALAAQLAARHVTPVILGAVAEREIAAAIRNACPVARDLTGQTSLAEIAALARQARVAVGNDTGPMHLIAAAGCRSVVLFSSESDPELCAPRGQVTVLRRADLAALPVAAVADALA